MPDSITYQAGAECIGNQCMSVKCKVPYIPFGYTKAVASCSFNSCSGHISGSQFERNTTTDTATTPASNYTWYNLQEGESLECLYNVGYWNYLNGNVGSLVCTITLYK